VKLGEESGQNLSVTTLKTTAIFPLKTGGIFSRMWW